MKTLIITISVLLTLFACNNSTSVNPYDNWTIVKIFPGDTLMLESYLTIKDNNLEIYKHFVTMEDSICFYPQLDKDGSHRFGMKFFSEKLGMFDYGIPFSCNGGQKWNISLYVLYGLK